MSLDPLVNEGMLYEWHRLLRPGGYVVITSDVSRYLTGTLTSSAGAVRAGAHPF